ncbi:MAG: SIS domain-containing protein [Sandaracinaceae bacterium]|nr:SIS domain-containing protein [Sandaracinaceae bacterium]
MCGVIGLVCDRSRADLGQIAGELLVALQYRGYDSAGAAVQGDAVDDVALRKGVGAPSDLVPELGIDRLEGKVFCGQVRWATFGVVDEKNAQPHVVRCKTFLYGAHNGNVTNCDALKEWLTAEGHEVLSDNDGEMVVHTVEHFFAEELTRTDDRDAAMRAAVVRASAKLEGSFAAVVVDPVTHRAVAIKRGSSLYFGLGSTERGAFAIASSDLSSVLGHTRVLVPLAEHEMVVYDANDFAVYATKDGATLEREPVRSHLRVEDAVLQPPFETFMEQEIHAQPETVRDALRVFGGGSDAARSAREKGLAFDASAHEALNQAFEALRSEYAEDSLRAALEAVAALPLAQALAADAVELASAERGFFADLIAIAPERERIVHGLDAFLEAREVDELARGVGQTVERMLASIERGGRIYLVCCGTSFHAAKAASLFFAELAGADVIPLLPGEFRGQYALTLRDGDLLVSVSQSGETKDLIDVVDVVIGSGLDIGRVAIVNNLNSTLAQEKSHVVVPLRCGPEIAVPATKSFLNQLTVFYGLARRLGEARGREVTPWPDLSRLVEQTIETTRAPLERAAELVHLAPSMHLLATRLLAVAKEGALKIREVVLNHTEGFEGSEFKHGPNTILGFNTLFGPAQVQALLDHVATSVAQAADPHRFVKDALHHSMRALYADYPLVFITGPDARDVDLTISQIHTHKIRGALPVMIAEEDPRLRAAIEKPPADRPDYRSVYVALPPTGDTLQAAFSASVALQLLALRMSVKKMAYLESLGLKDHGVHPDVPKNVSKSITVD